VLGFAEGLADGSVLGDALGDGVGARLLDFTPTRDTAPKLELLPLPDV